MQFLETKPQNMLHYIPLNYLNNFKPVFNQLTKLLHRILLIGNSLAPTQIVQLIIATFEHTLSMISVGTTHCAY